VRFDHVTGSRFRHGAKLLRWRQDKAAREPVIGKISQETLAEIVGTTRSRVSVFMNKFRKLGFIEYNGHLEVHNSLLNVVLFDNPQLRREE
jgi:CRP/FNR family transcriptional regulator, cyclic AMP receptor protein